MKQKKVTLPSNQWIAFGRFRGLLEYTPSGYDFSNKSVKYPIIIFFHGRASRGFGTSSELCRLFKDMGGDLATHKSIPGRVERQTTLFSPTDAQENTHHFIVVSPQFNTYDRVYPEPPGGNVYPSANAIDSVINYLVETRFKDKIDKRRIYLTGYSNGANMITEYAGSSVARAKKVAAIVPVALCSQLGHFSNAGITAANISNANLKTWFIYCKDDACGSDVPLAWVNAIKNTPGNSVIPRLTTLTENFPDSARLYNCSDTLEHDAWSRAYDPNFTASFTGNGTGVAAQGSVNDGVNQNIYEWLINQQSAVLPVVLKSFAVRLINNRVEVNWITTDEKNNSHFTIERAGDDQKFSSIGTVPGAGDNTGEKAYSFTDNNPLAGLNYYRLVQTDIDGKKSYFEIKRILNSSNKNSSVIVSPNPFGENLSAFINLDKSQKLYITVSDMTGKILKTTNGIYGQGSSELKIQSGELPKGIYLLKVSGENFNSTQKVIKK